MPLLLWLVDILYNKIIYIFCRQSVYLGPNISVNSLIEETKQLKLKEKIKLYNLENDYLFGRPLSRKWEELEK